MNISSPFIRRPVMTTFIMLTIVLAGWLAFIKLPVSDLPTIERPHIQVTAGYLGASPETVLNQVTIPLEKELTHVKGVKEISSTSSSGFSTISLAFDLSKNMDEAVRDVQSALNRAEPLLPREVDPRPAYQLQEDSQEPIMYLLLTSDNLSVGALRSYADAYIIPRLSRLEGVAQVKTFGAEKSIWVRLNPELMAARQIGFNEVVDALKQQTSQMPLGSIQTSSKRLSIELLGALQHAKELEQVKIGKGGMRLKDIAEISEKSDQDQEFHFLTPETKSLALILGIQKISDANTVSISKSVQEVIASLNKELPASIHLNLWFDKAIWIQESITDVQWSLGLAFALVVLVIYFSLGRLSESLITSAALPLSLLGTFVVMYLANFSLDLLSLLALTLCVGFVVDDAIVVLENIVRFQEKGSPPRPEKNWGQACNLQFEVPSSDVQSGAQITNHKPDPNFSPASPLEASLQGSKQICFTIVSMTLSLVAVFLPLLFMEGINGRLFREFSVTLAVAILVSGFVSLTLTPMLCSRFLSAHTEQNRLQKGITGINKWMVGIYGWTLKRCFRYPKLIISIAVVCVGLTVMLFSRLPVNLIPGEDRGFLFAFVSLPAGMAPTQVSEQQKDLEALVQKNTKIESFLCLNFNGTLLFVIRLHPLPNRPPQGVVMGELQHLFDAIPGTQAFIQPYQLINLDIDFGNAGQYEMVVRGMEFADVENATTILTHALQSNAAFSFAKSSLKNDSPMLVMRIDEEQAHKLGFNKQQIQALMQHAFGQGSVGSIQKGATQEKIFMELLPEYQNNANALSKLYLATPDGSYVPMRAVANWKEKLGSPDLARQEQLPSASIRFSLADTVAPNVGLMRAEEIAAEVLPSNVSAVLAGAAKAISSTISNTLLLLLGAAVVMYIVLGILYESFIHPLTILSSLPFAGLGGVLTLFLFGEPISIFSSVGFLLLIGIVKKNGIMMIDYAVEARGLGSDPESAIYDACMARFRPIMMTTVAAIMGAIPIAIGFGDGAEMRRGLGLVIVGGLVFSQLLTLYVTPIIYLSFERLFARGEVEHPLNRHLV